MPMALLILVAVFLMLVAGLVAIEAQRKRRAAKRARKRQRKLRRSIDGIATATVREMVAEANKPRRQ